MLQIRRDTPCRVGKKAQLGFGAFVISPLSLVVAQVSQSEQWAKAVKQSQDEPPEFFNDAQRLCLRDHGGYHTVQDVVEALTERGGSYSETKLPRGHAITPAIVQGFLANCHVVAKTQGKSLIAHDMTRLVQMFPRTFPIAYVAEKLVVKDESWWREWAMV